MVDQILTYVDIGFWVLILLSVLIAFLRGFKKNFNHLIGTIVVIILCLLLTDVVSRLLIEIDITFLTHSAESKTAMDIIKKAIVENLNITVESGSVTEQYLNALALAVFRVPVYLVMFIVGMLIVRPFIGLIARLLIPIPKGKKFFGRMGGVALEVVTLCLVFFFGLGLLLGVEGVAQDLIEYAEENNLIEEDNNVGNESISQIKEYIDIIESKPFFKMVSLVSGKNHKLQVKLLGNLTKIKTENTTLNIIKEKDNLLPIASIYLSIDSDDTFDIVNAFIDKRDVLINSLSSSTILEFVMPLAVEIAEQKVEIEGADWSTLSNVDWKKEKESILGFFNEVLTILDEVDLSKDTVSKESEKFILRDENLANYLKRIGQKLETITILKDFGLKVLDNYLSKSLKENLDPALQDLVDVLKLSEADLSSDFERIGYVLNDLCSLGIFDEVDINIIASKDTINDLLDRILSISLVQGNEEKIIKSLITYFKFDEKLQSMSLTLNYDNVTDWTSETQLIKGVLMNLLNLVSDNGYTSFDDLDFMLLLKNSEGNTNLEGLVHKICNSELLGESVVQLIDQFLTSNDMKQWESDEFKGILDGTITYNPANFESDILTLISIINDIDDLGVDFSNIDFNSLDDETIDTLFSILERMNNTNNFTISPIVEYLNNALTDMGYTITLIDIIDINESGSNKDEWVQEIYTLKPIVKEFKEIDGLDTSSLSTNSEAIGKVLNKMKESLLFGNDVMHDGVGPVNDDIYNQFMIQSFKMFGLIGINGFIDETLANTVDFTTYNYEEELSILSVYDTNQDFSEQTDDNIKTLSRSHLIKDLFNISGFIDEKVQGVCITIPPTATHSLLYTFVLSDYIDVDEEALRAKPNWDADIDALNELLDVFNGDVENFQIGLESIINNPNYNGTEAQKTATAIKTEFD